jgi:hypothetical protein
MTERNDAKDWSKAVMAPECTDSRFVCASVFRVDRAHNHNIDTTITPTIRRHSGGRSTCGHRLLQLMCQNEAKDAEREGEGSGAGRGIFLFSLSSQG